MRTPLLIATSLLLGIGLSGCTQGTGDCSGSSIASNEGNLAFNGACTGTQSSTFSCDGSGEASVAINLAKGEVEVTIKDDGGDTIYHKEQGSGPFADDHDLTGKSGQWTVKAERKGDISGQYAINVDCE
jgi:hypothetical protein